jgi:hypothetical protein
MGERPAPFSRYCYDLLRFSRENKFQYPYRDLPAPGATDRGLAAAQSPTAARGSLP